MGGNFCQILELGGGTTIKGRRVLENEKQSEKSSLVENSWDSLPPLAS